MFNANYASAALFGRQFRGELVGRNSNQSMKVRVWNEELDWQLTYKDGGTDGSRRQNMLTELSAIALRTDLWRTPVVKL